MISIKIVSSHKLKTCHCAECETEYNLKANHLQFIAIPNKEALCQKHCSDCALILGFSPESRIPNPESRIIPLGTRSYLSGHGRTSRDVVVPLGTRSYLSGHGIKHIDITNHLICSSLIRNDTS